MCLLKAPISWEGLIIIIPIICVLLILQKFQHKSTTNDANIPIPQCTYARCKNHCVVFNRAPHSLPILTFGPNILITQIHRGWFRWVYQITWNVNKARKLPLDGSVTNNCKHVWVYQYIKFITNLLIISISKRYSLISFHSSHTLVLNVPSEA